MQNRKNEASNYLSEFSHKIRSEQLAITSQIKKYKLNYLSKVVEKGNIDNFIRFARQLQLLIISYCKNIIYVAPENLSITIEELTLLFDDLLKKYHHLFLKYHEKFNEQAAQEVKGHSLSELCAVCGQQMKKVSIDKMKSYILNEIDLNSLEKYEDSDSSKVEEDAQFFQQVNNLLNIKHGELVKNQIQINNYKEIALNALNYLTTLKDHFNRESLMLPNSTWLKSAKQEMQAVLKQSFQGKIPPWIGKMLAAFWSHYQKQIEKKRCEIGTQTDNNTQLEIIELRKRVLVGKEKLQTEQNLRKTLERELLGLRGQKTNLEAKIDYYKNELTKLIEEIENAKMENKIMRMKMSISKYNQGNQKSEAEKDSNNESNRQISRSYILDSRKSHKNRNKNNHQSLDQRVFPKLKGKPSSKNSQQIRTSIKVDISSRSQSRLQFKKSTKKIEKIEKVSEATIGNSSKNEQMNLSLNETYQSIVPNLKQQRAQKQSHQISDSSLLKSAIKQEFQELNMQDYKLRIKEVDEQMKMAVKQGIFLKNGLKNFGSASTQAALKRVPRQTIKAEELDDAKLQLKKNKELASKRNNNLLKLTKIYNYLKQAGYLIKISEQDFKESIMKIKLFEPELALKPNQLSETKRSFFNNRRRLNDKDSLLKRSLYEESSFQEQRYNSNSLDRSFDQNAGSSYLPLFINIQNAYLYESNISKSHYIGASKLQGTQLAPCQQFYELVSQLKAANIEHYRLVCSFLRFPYQVVTNSFGSLNVSNDLKYATFEFYFQRILVLHQKCKKHEGVCQHLREFRNRLREDYESLQRGR